MFHIFVLSKLPSHPVLGGEVSPHPVFWEWVPVYTVFLERDPLHCLLGWGSPQFLVGVRPLKLSFGGEFLTQCLFGWAVLPCMCCHGWLVCCVFRASHFYVQHTRTTSTPIVFSSHISGDNVSSSKPENWLFTKLAYSSLCRKQWRASAVLDHLWSLF